MSCQSTPVPKFPNGQSAPGSDPSQKLFRKNGKKSR
ncbi:unnamed protein product, partial [Staurois parvus]